MPCGKNPAALRKKTGRLADKRDATARRRIPGKRAPAIAQTEKRALRQA